MGLEDSGLDGDAGQADVVDEVLVEGAGLFGGRGGIETGAASLAAIAVEGELRDGQNRSPRSPAESGSFCSLPKPGFPFWNSRTSQI